jgi:hypothetical protein
MKGHRLSGSVLKQSSFPAAAADSSTRIIGVRKVIPFKAVWRNGSASDYESGGCSFEYYLGHLFFFVFLDRFLPS